MKKEWNAPAILDLTIQATAWGGKGSGKGSHNESGMWGGNSDICNCQGGTSPCEFHQHITPTPDTLS